MRSVINLSEGVDRISSRTLRCARISRLESKTQAANERAAPLTPRAIPERGNRLDPSALDAA